MSDREAPIREALEWAREYDRDDNGVIFAGALEALDGLVADLERAERETELQMQAKLDAQQTLMLTTRALNLKFSELGDGWKEAAPKILERITVIVDEAERGFRERDAFETALEMERDRSMTIATAEAAVAAKDAALAWIKNETDRAIAGGSCSLIGVSNRARAALAVGDATEPGYNLVHAAEFVDARNESSSVPGDATETPEISALASLVKDGVPLPEGTCPRCRGMGGIYVASNGGRTFVRCPECKGVPGDSTETPRESIESYAKRSGWMNDPDVEPGVPGVVQTPEETP